MNQPNFRAYVAWIAICIIWGTTYLAIRVGVTELPPMLFAGFRWIIAGGILLILMNLRGHALPRVADLKHLAVVGIALLGIANGLVVVAEQWIPSGLTALLISTLPFWMVTFESLNRNGPGINKFIISGIILGTAGVILIFSKDLEVTLDMQIFIGSLCLLGAVISWSLGSIYWKYKQVQIHPMMGASVQMLIAGILQTLLGLILGEYSEFQFTKDSFLAFSYLVIVGSIFGYASYIYAIAHLPLSLVSMYAYINPVIALIAGWYFLEEKLTVFILVATILILTGVMLVKKGSTVAVKKLNLS